MARFVQFLLIAGMLLVPAAMWADKKNGDNGRERRNGQWGDSIYGRDYSGDSEGGKQWRKEQKERDKERREAWREAQKDRREAEREWQKDRREAAREALKERREAQREWDKDRREAARENNRDDDHYRYRR